MPNESNYTGKPPIHYTPFEVVVHNKAWDCWVSLLGRVLNITPLISEYKYDNSIMPLLAFAGKDISNWFDKSTGDIRYHIHPVTGARVPYCPHGRIPHVDVQVPATKWYPLLQLPWWKDKKYEIGLLTKKVRPIRIINTLLLEEVKLDVCSEDTILRIKERYSIFNSDATSYYWRHNCKTLNDELSLEGNGILDERNHFVDCGLPPNFYIPVIMLTYKDDFKWTSQRDDMETKYSTDVQDINPLRKIISFHI